MKLRLSVLLLVVFLILGVVQVSGAQAESYSQNGISFNYDGSWKFSEDKTNKNFNTFIGMTEDEKYFFSMVIYYQNIEVASLLKEFNGGFFDSLKITPDKTEYISDTVRGQKVNGVHNSFVISNVSYENKVYGLTIDGKSVFALMMYPKGDAATGERMMKNMLNSFKLK